MYTLYIVDDENAIREGIAKSIPWHAWGFDLRGSFANGQQALEAIRQSPPDVVLTDIRMPVMDGVELMTALNAEFPRVKIIILSGYSDFEYLQTSIKNNVAEYLLKPTNIAKFKMVFQGVREKLDEERMQERELAMLQAEAQEARHIRRLGQIANYLRGNFDETAIQQAEALFQPGDMPGFDRCVVVVLAPDGRSGDEERDLYQLKTGILASLGAEPDSVFLLGSGEIITGIINLRKGDIPRDLRPRLLALQHRLHGRFNTSVSVGVSSLCSGAGGLHIGYQQAQSSARQSIFFGAGTLFFYDEFAENATKQPELEPFDIETLKNRILEGDYQQLADCIDTTIAAYEKRPLENHQTVDYYCMEALLNIASWCGSLRVDFIALMDSLGAEYMDIRKCDSLKGKAEFMKCVLFAVMHALQKGRGYTGPVSAMALALRSVVDEEYANNALSLEYLADRFKKTPAYISRVFKNELGMNFSDYVTKRRLERACELLSDPAVKVYEVAQLVGYASSSNFIRLFKKEYGASPNDYRVRKMMEASR